jgi:AAA+ ATPase superfamily predicted ATPase
MLEGRAKELEGLEKSYNSGKNTLTILYGRTNIGKTALLREFIKGKNCLYYSAVQASQKEQMALFLSEMKTQLKTHFEKNKAADVEEDYRKLFGETVNIDAPMKLVIIEEFQNIVKQDKEFMNAVSELVKGQLYDEKVMVICTSSSVSWIENSMVSAIGTNAYAITAFLKLKEMSFVDTVRMFPAYSVADCIMVYAITGGVPGYMAEFTDAVTIKENICRNILVQGKLLRTAGSDYIKEELRETSLYNTILSCIANGEYKLNELHVHTGFGRDKISVYLKNLIEREIVDKLFSYDTEGNEHTRKGLYRIKAGFMEFWFRYIYQRESQLAIMEPEQFYDTYIADSLNDFVNEAFIKVGTEFIELLDSLGKLEIKIERKGRWWGKNGDIDMIACDDKQQYVITKCSWKSEVFMFSLFEELMYNINLAGIGKNYIYLFSKGTFDEELKIFAAENSNIKLISLSDL